MGRGATSVARCYRKLDASVGQTTRIFTAASSSCDWRECRRLPDSLGGLRLKRPVVYVLPISFTFSAGWRSARVSPSGGLWRIIAVSDYR